MPLPFGMIKIMWQLAGGSRGLYQQDQFLFKITKGILDISDKTVNESQKDESKPVLSVI